MPAYKYEALTDAGRQSSGLIEADNPRVARAMVRAQGLTPLSIEMVQQHGAQEGSRFTRRVFGQTALAVWTRQLAGLVGSSLPIERALTALADESEDSRQRELISQLKAEVNAGSTFARALALAPREFDEVYRGVVAAGEQSGALGQVLERLADDLEERQDLKAKLVGAMAYPAIVSFISVLIVIFLVTYVVPQIATVFTSSKRTLPALTVAMLAISDFVRTWGWAMLGVLASGGLLLRQALKARAFRLRFDAAMLGLPVVGRLARGYNAARFAGTLAMLAGAGVPILKALQAAAETLSNRAMQADALDALVQVREGAPLGSALAGKKRFPGILAMFARLGEQTGQLPEMLGRAARQLSVEVQRRSMAAATLLEPLLIVAMGAIVLLIVLAVLLPIIQLNTWVK
ncbi:MULTISPECIES: type II secretion system inner membrane protein GspF [unclassified Roseateles]|uniref:type II secretion system inner membrane protein GspF n=1 Tax=unclassified Roseateles TaxID=2626991 RepID=UPI0007010EB1|nr:MULTISPECIES: type II secretion system inner membrane protein GspF [unclassified Roseateles]KQW51672.1 type II secretion system protein GspF [Pelomonas sp. Root405]KRA77905.1 type II secretion system protein GspF [Pelomonas sp. Root662]